MARLTYSEMKGRLQRMLGNRGFSDSRLGDWVHDGLYELGGGTKMPEDECIVSADLTVDDGEYGLPNDLVAIQGVKIDEEQRVLKITPQEYFKKDFTADSALPELYTRVQDHIRLYPVPDETYTMSIFYRREHPALVADNDQHEYDSQWDRAILLFAAHHAHMDLGESTRANDFLRRAAIYVRSRIHPDELEAEAPAERGVNVARSKSDIKGLET